jgi:methyl-accepting chemotaxis protein
MNFISRLNLKRQMLLLAVVALIGFIGMTLAGAYAITYAMDPDLYWIVAGSVFLVGTILMFGAANYLGSRAGNRAYTVVKAMGSMAKGDLTNKVRVEGKDEFSWMAYEYDSARKAVASLLNSVTETALALANASDELSSITRESLVRVDSQKSRTDQVVQAMKGMYGKVQDVAQNASTASGAAQEADKESAAGRGVVMQTEQAIETLAHDVEQSVGVIQVLESESRNIGTVLDVIRGIAEQTNLLALNAAIEAARAGDHGRGFAVVADEVRTLAQRTQKSTQDIQDKIERLQTESGNAVKVMTEERDRAHESVRQAELAGTSLETIASRVKTITDMNAKIAAAAREQSAMAEKINQDMQQIGEISDQTSISVQATAGAALALAGQADRLKELVSKFKV